MTDRHPSEFALVDDSGAVLGWMVPDLPDGAPPEVLEGMTRRRLAALNGSCPCGATVQMPNRAARRRATRAGEACRAVVEHEDDCPAISSVVVAAMRRWSA